jgi:kynurenine formamidase
MMTYWSLGGQRMLAVEFVRGLGKLADQVYFIFATVKIRGCHVGPGRAIALY